MILDIPLLPGYAWEFGRIGWVGRHFDGASKSKSTKASNRLPDPPYSLHLAPTSSTFSSYVPALNWSLIKNSEWEFCLPYKYRTTLDRPFVPHGSGLDWAQNQRQMPWSPIRPSVLGRRSHLPLPAPPTDTLHFSPRYLEEIRRCTVRGRTSFPGGSCVNAKTMCYHRSGWATNRLSNAWTLLEILGS